MKKSFKSINKIKEVGMWYFIVGCMKRTYYIQLCKKYRFDPWHTAPFEHRRYIIETAKYINDRSPACVVDIGCGIGDMLRKMSAKQLYGYDISKEAIAAARHLSKNDIEYNQGTFDAVKVPFTIDFVTALGFMHGNDEEFWKPYFETLCKNNDVRHIVVDIFPKDPMGWRHLNFSNILPNEYKKVKILGPFRAYGGDGKKFVEIWEKSER